MVYLGKEAMFFCIWEAFLQISANHVELQERLKKRKKEAVGKNRADVNLPYQNLVLRK